MKTIGILSLLLLTISCSTTLPPKEQRSLTFVEETKVTKDVAYTNALAYIAKSFGNSNEVIKTQDKTSGLVVIKGNTSCNIFRQWGDVNNYLLQFTLELNFKDNKARFLFDDLFISHETGKAVMWENNQLTDKAKVEKAGECLAPLRNGILSSFSSKDW